MSHNQSLGEQWLQSQDLPGGTDLLARGIPEKVEEMTPQQLEWHTRALGRTTMLGRASDGSVISEGGLITSYLIYRNSVQGSAEEVSV